ARDAERVHVVLGEQRRADKVGRAPPCGVAVGHAHVGRPCAEDERQAARAGFAGLPAVRTPGLVAELGIALEVVAAGVGARHLGRETDAANGILAVLVGGALGDGEADPFVSDEVGANTVAALRARAVLARVAPLQRRALAADGAGRIGLAVGAGGSAK